MTGFLRLHPLLALGADGSASGPLPDPKSQLIAGLVILCLSVIMFHSSTERGHDQLPRLGLRGVNWIPPRAVFRVLGVLFLAFAVLLLIGGGRVFLR